MLGKSPLPSRVESEDCPGRAADRQARIRPQTGFAQGAQSEPRLIEKSPRDASQNTGSAEMLPFWPELARDRPRPVSSYVPREVAAVEHTWPPPEQETAPPNGPLATMTAVIVVTDVPSLAIRLRPP